MRDALSLLDQLIAFGGGKVDEASARGMLGTIDRAHVVHLARALATGDAQKLLEIARGLEEFAPDYGQVLDDLAALLTRVALRQIVTGYEADELFDAALIAELATAIGAEDVQLYLSDRHSRSPRPRAGARSPQWFPDDAGAHAGVSSGRRGGHPGGYGRRARAGHRAGTRRRAHRAAGIRRCHRPGAVGARDR